MSAGTLIVCDGCGESEFHAGTVDQARRYLAVEMGWRAFQDTGCGDHVGTFEMADYCPGCEAEDDPEMTDAEAEAVPGVWVRWLRNGLAGDWAVHDTGNWAVMTVIPDIGPGAHAWAVLPEGRHPDDWKKDVQ